MSRRPPRAGGEVDTVPSPQNWLRQPSRTQGLGSPRPTPPQPQPDPHPPLRTPSQPASTGTRFWSSARRPPRARVRRISRRPPRTQTCPWGQAWQLPQPPNVVFLVSLWAGFKRATLLPEPHPEHLSKGAAFPVHHRLPRGRSFLPGKSTCTGSSR